ncbi:hypothetical protein RF11_05299 [Thelohanellus kitauei]|uniref:Uncharacterized protein n=1 Tax=Thelohanellus kitauei TaxID=669202 RepID=A0A0C2MP29_THEKT|nr:hypothetical protein RF11_05299 [Thelohanellus kitauei]
MYVFSSLRVCMEEIVPVSLVKQFMLNDKGMGVKCPTSTLTVLMIVSKFNVEKFDPESYVALAQMCLEHFYTLPNYKILDLETLTLFNKLNSGFEQRYNNMFREDGLFRNLATLGLDLDIKFRVVPVWGYADFNRNQAAKTALRYPYTAPNNFLGCVTALDSRYVV